LTVQPEFRDAVPDDAEPLAQLWHSGWQDAHHGLLPAELTRQRTARSFLDRMNEHLADVRVAAAAGRPLGFAMFKDDELYQFYVSAEARGTGIAALLMRDAESTMCSRGVKNAWLACAIGNERAARFYAKQGWQLIGNKVIEVTIPGGLFPLEVWRYEKQLGV
jgi:GNAT superfamily N-acetyltransferase